MRGHGDVVVAPALQVAVFRAVYTEINARLEAEALRLGQGEVTFLNEKEAAAASPPTSRGGPRLGAVEAQGDGGRRMKLISAAAWYERLKACLSAKA